jgi:hypothetical protein
MMTDRLCTCGHRQSDHFLTDGVCLIDYCACLKFEPLSTTASFERTVKRWGEEESGEEPEEAEELEDQQP